MTRNALLTTPTGDLLSGIDILWLLFDAEGEGVCSLPILYSR